MNGPNKNPAPGGNRSGADRSKRFAADHTAPIDRLLARLDAPREVGFGKWIARCPAHDDRHPSLSIRETSDGRVLIHCFSGCAPTEVLASVGLGLADLFEKQISHHLPKAGVTYPALPVLRALTFEASIVFMAGAALLAGEPFDSERLQVALHRIDAALRVAEGRA